MKIFSTELAIISQIENFDKQKIIIGTDVDETHITKSKTSFRLFYDGVFPYSEDKNLIAHICGVPYTLKSYDFKKPIDSRLVEIPCEHAMDIEALYKGSLGASTFFRMFFFDDSGRSNIFHYKLESPKHDGIVPWAPKSVRITINQKRYDIVQHKEKKKDQSYIIIENLDEVTYKEFKKDSYAIQKGIGFLTGYMPGGENYIFSGENVEYQRLSRKSLKSVFYPVTSNPHSFIDHNGNYQVAENYENKVKTIPATIISDFITKIWENEELSVAIIFMMEISSLKSVVSMPGAFSVVLESLANILITKKAELVKLIDKPEVAEDFIIALQNVLEQYEGKISPEATIKLKRKLNAINQPLNFNNLSNAIKLREPFDQFGICLSEMDEKAIEYRNDLLHGNILMNGKEKKTSKQADDHMMYISAKLYTLIAKLLLKNSGYKGYVINHAKFFEHNLNNTTEDFFQEI